MYKQVRKPDLTLHFTAPTSMNGAYSNVARGGKAFRIKSPRYNAWLQVATTELLYQKHKRIKGYVSIVHTLYFNDCIKRDCANYEKCMTDMLVKYKVIDDDSNICQNIQQFSSFTEKQNRDIARVDIYKLTQEEAKLFMHPRMARDWDKKW